MESYDLGSFLVDAGMFLLLLYFFGFIGGEPKQEQPGMTPLQSMWSDRKRIPEMMGDPEMSDLANECLLFMHNEIFKLRMAEKNVKHQTASGDPHEMLEIDADSIESDRPPTGVELANSLILFMQHQLKQYQENRITLDQLHKYQSLYDKFTKIGFDLLAKR